MPVLPERIKRLSMTWFIAAAAVLAQSSANRPVFDSFEVATIKPAAGDSAGRYIRMQTAHQLFAKNHTVKSLIASAYNLSPRAISGGPAWTESDHYDILAEAPNAVRPNPDEQMSMLRKLLSDRFRLTFHREEKELPVYKLTVANNGPKLRTSTVSPDASPEGPPPLVFVLYPHEARLPGRNATVAELAAVMQKAALDRPVLDKTGLSGRFDFDLEWTTDETQFGGQGPSGSSESPKPDLFAAIQQQLGLKLEADKRAGPDFDHRQGRAPWRELDPPDAVTPRERSDNLSRVPSAGSEVLTEPARFFFVTDSPQHGDTRLRLRNRVPRRSAEACGAGWPYWRDLQGISAGRILSASGALLCRSLSRAGRRSRFQDRRLRRRVSCFSTRRYAPHSRADSRQQFLNAERLGDVIIRAGVQDLYFVALGIADRQYNDGHVGSFADSAAGFEASNTRHVEIEQDQIRMIRAQDFERLLAGFRFDNGVAQVGQRCLHGATQLRLIVDDKYCRKIHGSLMITAAPPPARFSA